jgi:tryptophanase
VDYVAEVILAVYREREELKGYRMEYEAPALRHFTARLVPV